MPLHLDNPNELVARLYCADVTCGDGSPTANGHRIKRMHHVGIVVDDLEEAKRFVSEVLGLTFLRQVDVPQRGRRTAWYRCGEVDIELIDDLDADSRSNALDGATARVEHIALEVDDVAAAVTSLAAFGVLVGPGGVVQIGSRLSAWTEPRTTDGVMYQLLAEVPAEKQLSDQGKAK